MLRQNRDGRTKKDKKNVCEKENQIADIFVSLSKCRERISNGHSRQIRETRSLTCANLSRRVTFFSKIGFGECGESVTAFW
jgi:hypothetical protein